MYQYSDGWHVVAGIPCMVRGGRVAWLDGGITLERWNPRSRHFENWGGRMTPRALYGALKRGNLRFKNADEFRRYAAMIGVDLTEERV